MHALTSLQEAEWLKPSYLKSQRYRMILCLVPWQKEYGAAGYFKRTGLSGSCDLQRQQRRHGLSTVLDEAAGKNTELFHLPGWWKYKKEKSHSSQVTRTRANPVSSVIQQENVDETVANGGSSLNVHSEMQHSSKARSQSICYKLPEMNLGEREASRLVLVPTK